LLAKLVELLAAPLDHCREPSTLAVKSRGQRRTLTLVFGAKPGQRLLLRLRCGRELVAFTLQITLKLGYFGFPRLQRRLQRLAFP